MCGVLLEKKWEDEDKNITTIPCHTKPSPQMTYELYTSGGYFYLVFIYEKKK